MKDALDDYVQEWKDFGLGEEIRIGYVAVTRARHLLLCSGSWWRDGVKPCGPSALLTTVREACEAGAGHGRALGGGARRRRDQPGAGGVAGRGVAGRPALRPDGAAALSAAAELVAAAAPHPLDPELVLDGGDPQLEQWVRDADLLLRERARHASPTVDVPLPSHLSVSALVTLRRDPAELARRLRRPMPARTRAAGPPGHRLPRLAGGAVRRGETGRPRRAARVRRRVRRPRRRAGRAAGGVPRQRVGRPAAGRGRGAVRDPAGPADPARPDRRRLRRRRRRGSRSSTGRPARHRRGPSWPPRRCSWPPTGWAGRG